MNTEPHRIDCQPAPGADTEERRGGSPAAPQGADPAKAGPLVTPSLLFSGPSSWEFLAANVDTLDLSFSVDWGDVWPRLTAELERQKIAAQNTQGILFKDTNTLIFPSGGKRFYQWHLKRPDIDLYLSQSPDSHSKVPNVTASPSARLLWERGPLATQQVVADWVTELGGNVAKCKISRLDLAADFSVPEGLSSQFLCTYCVCKSRKRIIYEDDSETETAYFGAAAAPIRLRIYDKTKELLKAPAKTWLPEVWGEQSYERVMRVEYQIRREALRELGVEKCVDLQKLGGVWTYLTTQWFSLRLLDDENSSRRSMHPLWVSVKSVARNLGKELTVQRTRCHAQPDVSRVLAQLRGYLVSFASLTGEDNLSEALDSVKLALLSRLMDQSFHDDVQERRIKYGIPEDSVDFDPKTFEDGEQP